MATSQTQNTAADDLDEHIVRQLLCSVEDNAEVSQRQLSGELGIALGSVNWYLKRCISKGLIKISQAPLKRYVYYLTPQGFEEKSRLMAQYLKWSLDFFRLGREQSAAIFEQCAAQGRTHAVLIGDGDLAEIFLLSSMDGAVTVHAIVDPAARHETRLRVPVLSSLSALPPMERPAYIMTDMNMPQAAWDRLRAAGVPADDIFIPDLLSFRPAAKDGV